MRTAILSRLRTFNFKRLRFLAEGDVSKTGQIIINEGKEKPVEVLEKIGGFQEQKRIRSTSPNG
ncbi:conserved hypothetical protein [Ricinus communis]|uniref:Uncharacterized protein n=1 Tax=Ricinus communis TaxID=3988 RepID=B9REZ4_RICCO|nr:conserved hypothetical protein [Ricinus communis]